MERWWFATNLMAIISIEYRAKPIIRVGVCRIPILINSPWGTVCSREIVGIIKFETP